AHSHIYIYTLSLHDALPIFFGSLMMGIPAGILAFVGIAILTYRRMTCSRVYKTSDINDIIVDWALLVTIALGLACTITGAFIDRSEEHTSELQSRFDLVCRL